MLMNRAVVGGAVACAVSVFIVAVNAAPSPTPVPSCPVPENYGMTASKANSPEKPKPLFAVCHKGKILCVPKNAADAHVAHGDTLLGSCTKPGNTGVPCPTPTPKPKPTPKK